MWRGLACQTAGTTSAIQTGKMLSYRSQDSFSNYNPFDKQSGTPRWRPKPRNVVHGLQCRTCYQPTENRELVQSQACHSTGNARKNIPLFNFPTFVLPHQDISPRNLVLDPSGQVWLIDWAFACAYPPCFEAATLTELVPFPDFSEQLLERIHTNPQETMQSKSIG
jgi:serine/threonine protein kinase